MRPDMLLFDVGNTSIKVGLAHADAITDTYTLRTDAGQTPDDFGLKLLALLHHAGIAPEIVRACVVSSVVPALEPLLDSACRRFMGQAPLFVPRDIPVPLHNNYEQPQEVGSDRLVAAYAARVLFPEPESLLCVDFGTAVTFDCVSGHSYLGGLIFPGPQTALSALSQHAARLPRVNLDVRCAHPAPGKNTVTSIQHGLLFGFASMVEGLCVRLKEQLPGTVAVVGTGGFAADVARVSSAFDHLLPALLLDGLRCLFVEHCKN